MIFPAILVFSSGNICRIAIHLRSSHHNLAGKPNHPPLENSITNATFLVAVVVVLILMATNPINFYDVRWND